MMRKTKASDRPIRRARLASRGEQRDTSTEMNTMLSTPSTISSAVSVASAAHAPGSVRSPNIAPFLFGPPQQARSEEVERDGTQWRGNPWPGHHVAQQCDKSEHRPHGKQTDRE